MSEESDDVSVSVTVREGEIYLRLYNHPWSTVARLTPSHAIEIGEMLVEIGKERSNQGKAE